MRLAQHPRFVQPCDDVRSAVFWCDGTVQGHEAHERVEYVQPRSSFQRGSNACPECGHGGRAYRLGRVAPEQVHRLVGADADAAHAPASSQRRVEVWCDGTVQGHEAHERIEYPTTVRALAEARNSCPVCGMHGSVHHLASVSPQAVGRLVDPAQATVRATSLTRVRVRCDGTLAGASPHPETTYTMTAASLAAGVHQCPQCRRIRLVARYGQKRAMRMMHEAPKRRRPPGATAAPRPVKLRPLDFGTLYPDMVQRLVVTRHQLRSTRSFRTFELWCDGTVAGRDLHPRTTYAQRVDHLDERVDDCPACRRED